MDWLTFIAEMVKSLAWPAFLFFTVLVFRKPLVELLPGLRRLRIKEIEIEFNRELRRTVLLTRPIKAMNPPPMQPLTRAASVP